MKYSGIALFADLDGTLLDDKRQLSDENLAAVRYFVENGGSFAVATGRMERSTLINFPELTVNTPSIFYNGALVYDINRRGKNYTRFICLKAWNLFSSIYLTASHPCGLEVNAKGEAYVIRYNDKIDFQLKREGFKGIMSGWDEVPREWYKILIADTRPILTGIKEYLKTSKEQILA